jgi:hypothetical protein
VLLEISGDSGGKWLLSRGTTGWDFVNGPVPDSASRVTIPQELAWRIFTKGIDRNEAQGKVKIDGDSSLGEKVLSLTAIVA